ncbi:MAG: TetR/AcrR family transcriptional regulator [Sphingobacterium sp.]
MAFFYFCCSTTIYIRVAKNKKVENVNCTTEERIIDAARQVFIQKGYSATRTRDIADKAGINLALLNYYFRSKEKLFQLIMEEKMQLLFSVIFPVANDEHLTLDEKLRLLIENYIDMLLENPDLPLFVIGEIKTNPGGFKDKLQVPGILENSSLIRQLRERRSDVEPVQFIVSLLGMTIFPFISRQILFPDDDTFKRLMQERKALATKWIKVILEV